MSWRITTPSLSAAPRDSAGWHRKWPRSSIRPARYPNAVRLAGKVGGAFTSPSSSHGGTESATLSILVNLLHFGMIIIGPPYSATTMADDSGQRHPSEHDLEGARQQGIVIARTAERLFDYGPVEALAEDQP